MKFFLYIAATCFVLFAIGVVIYLAKYHAYKWCFEHIFSITIILCAYYICIVQISSLFCDYEKYSYSAKIQSNITQQLSCKADDISIAAVTNDNKLVNIEINPNTKLVKDNKNIIYFEKQIAVKPSFVLKIFWNDKQKNIATEIHY